MTLHSEIFEQPERLAALLVNQKQTVFEIAKAIKARNVQYAFLAARGTSDNAGRYASRNASFQKIIRILSKIKLATDGDLLLYNKDQQPLTQVSGTEAAARRVIQKFNLSIDDKKLRADLIKEKSADFPTTQTYLLLRDLYSRSVKQPIAFAEIPSIELTSPKIRHHMTTQNFAESVDKRYQKCMMVKP